MTPEQTNPLPTPTLPLKEEQLIFDAAVCERIKRCYEDIFVDHPEVAALIGVVSWAGDLNDAHLLHGVWLGRDGIVATPAQIFGSMWQVLKMLDTQMERAIELLEHMQKRVVALGNEEIKKHEEIEQRRTEIKELDQLIWDKKQELCQLTIQCPGPDPDSSEAIKRD